MARGTNGRRVVTTHTTVSSAHTALDVVVAKVAIADLMRDAGASGYLSAFGLVDKSDTPQISAHDLVVDFWKASDSVGAADAAFAPSDAQMLDWLHGFTIESSEWIDTGSTGQRVSLSLGDQRLGALLVAASGTRNVYMTIYTVGTPTPASTADLVSMVGVIDA